MISYQKIDLDKLKKHHLNILKSMQYASGLFAASKKDVSTGYDKAWLRDNFYECLAFEVLGDWKTVKKTYRAILDIFLKHEEKIDCAIREKPDANYKYIHPRYHPETFEEFWEEWGFKQHDSIGAILFKIGELEVDAKVRILESSDDYRIVQKLIDYLSSIEYWHDPDSGVWEENEEIHSSSIGACIAGLTKASEIKRIKVDPELVNKGKAILDNLLPRESEKKFADLALLSLIYPYDVVNREQRKDILKNVEYHLEKNRGVIRYKNDYYYNRNVDGHSEEAEWTMGLSWIAIIYEKLGKRNMAKHYIKKALATITKEGTMPELYFSNTKIPNENTPLGWAESLFIVALHKFQTEFEKQVNRG